MKPKKTPEKRRGPLSIPLPFTKAVEGLLGVNPKDLPTRKPPTASKKPMGGSSKKKRG